MQEILLNNSGSGPGGHGDGALPFYNSLDYCRCLEEFGKPVRLDPVSGYLLARDIPGTNRQDLIFPYPMYTVSDEGRLADGLKAGPGVDYVSVTIVTDPLHPFDPDSGKWDLARSWKTHLILDAEGPAACSFPDKVRYYSKRAAARFGFTVDFEREGKAGILPDWLRLWSVLSARHGLSGLKALSDGYFRRLFSLGSPVLAILRDDDGIHSIHIWITDGLLAYSHLHASDDRAYECSANYLLYSETLRWLTECGCRRCLLGSSAGSGSDDGLFRFKAQFSNARAENSILGMVLDAAAYRDLGGSNGHSGGYFPAYRSGELL